METETINVEMLKVPSGEKAIIEMRIEQLIDNANLRSQLERAGFRNLLIDFLGYVTRRVQVVTLEETK